jgi:hypothetical protein
MYLPPVPFNTKRVYVQAVTLDGCEIYMPVDSNDEKEQKRLKDRLQRLMDHQYIPTGPFRA